MQVDLAQNHSRFVQIIHFLLSAAQFCFFFPELQKKMKRKQKYHKSGLSASSDRSDSGQNRPNMGALSFSKYFWCHYVSNTAGSVKQTGSFKRNQTQTLTAEVEWKGKQACSQPDSGKWAGSGVTNNIKKYGFGLAALLKWDARMG